MAELVGGPGEVKTQITIPIIQDKGTHDRVLPFGQQFPRQYLAVDIAEEGILGQWRGVEECESEDTRR